MFFYNFLLKRVKNEENFESSIFFEAQKHYSVFNWGLIFVSNGHIGNVVSTLPKVVKIDVENDNVSTLSNVVQFNVEKHNAVSTLFKVVNFNVDLTLCNVATSYQPKNNVEPTSKCLLGIVLYCWVLI